MKKRIFFIVIAMLFLLKIILIDADVAVYMYQQDSNGIKELLQVPPDSNGEIGITGGYQTVFLNDKPPLESVGTMKNVVVKPQGDKFIIIFREGGELSKFYHDPERQLDYKNIKSGGKLTFDKAGKLVGGDFETTKAGSYSLNGYVYELPAGAKVFSNSKSIELTLTKGGKFSYNKEGSEDKKTYEENIKAGGKIVIDSNGKVSDGTEFVVGTGGGDFKIRGNTITLPENTKVIYSDGKVKIIVPDNGKIENPGTYEENEAGNYDIEIVSESSDGKIKLPNDYDASGTLKLRNGLLSFAGQGKIDGMDIENSKKEITLFFDDKSHLDFVGSFIHFGEKLVIGSTDIDNLNDFRVVFKSGNEYFKNLKNEYVAVQAGRENLQWILNEKETKTLERGAGIVMISKENGNLPVKIETMKSAIVYNGDLAFSTIDEGNKQRGLYFIRDPNSKGKESYPLRIENYHNIEGDYVLRDEQGAQDIIINEKGQFAVVYANQEVEMESFSSSGERARLKYSFETIPTLKTRSTGVAAGSSMLNLVEAHTSSRYNREGGILTKIHEETHFANSDLTSKYGPNSAYDPNPNTFRAFLTGRVLDNGEAEAVLVQGTGVRKSLSYAYLPRSLWEATSGEYVGQGVMSFYDTYLRGVHSNKDAVHTFEDSSAYYTESVHALDYTKSTGRQLDAGSFGQLMAASLQPVIVGVMLENQNPNYLQSEAGTQYKALMARNIEDAMQVYREASSNSQLAGYLGYSEKILRSIRTNPDSQNLRNFLVRTYGKTWTERTLGF